MTFGERLHQLRKDKKWSQRELARRARVNFAVISRLESGDRMFPSIPVAKRLARTLGVTLDYLCGMYEDELGELGPAVMELDGTPHHDGSCMPTNEHTSSIIS